MTRLLGPGVRAVGRAALCLVGAVAILAIPSGLGGSDPTAVPPASCTASPGDTLAPRIAMGGLAREPLEATGRAPGAGGTLEISFASSPYGLAVGADGHPRYSLTLETRGLRPPPDRRPVAWAATPELDRVRRLGPLDAGGSLTGAGVEWSRFLVFVTAEPVGAGEDASDRTAAWEGPILLVGRAPSSRMHTMRGHGIFEAHGIGC